MVLNIQEEMYDDIKDRLPNNKYTIILPLSNHHYKIFIFFYCRMNPNEFCYMEHVPCMKALRPQIYENASRCKSITKKRCKTNPANKESCASANIAISKLKKQELCTYIETSPVFRNKPDNGRNNLPKPNRPNRPVEPVVVKVPTTDEWFVAVKNNNIELVRDYIRKGIDVNIIPPRSKKTALCFALEHNKNDMVSLLLEEGADPNKICGAFYLTPLYNAIKRLNKQAVSLLLKAGADPNADYYIRDTVSLLERLLRLHPGNRKIDICFEILILLINAGANIDNPNDINIHFFINNDKLYPYAIRLIKETNINVNQPDRAGKVPLLKAIRTQNIPLIMALLQRGADPNAIDRQEEVPIYLLIFDFFQVNNNNNENNRQNNNEEKYNNEESREKDKKALEVFDAMLQAGANPSIPFKGMDLLHLLFVMNPKAKYKLMEKILDERLGERQANPDSVDQEGKTALDIAVSREDKKAVQILLDHDATDTEFIQQLVNRNEITSRAILDLLRDKLDIVPTQQAEQSKWKGWSKADIAQLQTAFMDPIIKNDGTSNYPANDHALCPVCLTYVKRDEGCMYMHHDCRKMGGFYHRELYQKYKSITNEINFCTICGRICSLDHHHYELSSPDGPKSELLPSGGFFDNDCRIRNGGGGLPEKLARYTAMRDKAIELNQQIDQITKRQALEQIVESAWIAPLNQSIMNRVTRQLEAKQFNRPNTNFPAPLRNQPNQLEVRIAPQLWQPPILHRLGADIVTGDDYVDEVKNDDFQKEAGDIPQLIQFRHRSQEENNQGDWLQRHERSLISRTSLQEFVERASNTFGTDDSAGLCFMHPECQSYLYPKEIKPFVSRALYKRYRAGFMRKFGIVAGGNNNSEKPQFLIPMMNASCAVPSKNKRNKSRKGGKLRKRQVTRKSK